MFIREWLPKNIKNVINMSSVSFVKRASGESIESTIQRSLDLIGFTYDQNIKNVVIKPNMCYYWDYTTGQTTDPMFVESIINLLKNNYNDDLNIFVVESDASAMKCKYAFKMLGYSKMAEKNNVNLINLSDDETEPYKIEISGNQYDFQLPLIIKNADLFINVPKIKYMGFNIYETCALKNIFGCNPYYRKHIYHKNISEVIVALNKLIKTDLCIVDGLIVSGIKPRKLDMVMSSIDPVATDVAAANLLGVNPNKVPYIKMAAKENVGKLFFNSKGDDIDYFKKNYPSRTLESKFMTFGYHMIKFLRLGKRMGLD